VRSVGFDVKVDSRRFLTCQTLNIVSIREVNRGPSLALSALTKD
jgi:hypothetical protein